jgi:hypothetical protein
MGIRPRGGEAVGRRVLAGGTLLTLAAASVVVWMGKPWSALALTVTASVGMINGLWLERVLATVLQPGKARISLGVVVVTAVRWLLWASLFGFLYLIRSRIEPWAVVVGIACFLVALGGAVVRFSRDTGGEG